MTYKDLKHLVTSLVICVKRDNIMDSEINKHVLFDCLLCLNMVDDPVTIPCGHTFCRSCLMKDASNQCRHCGTVNHNLNVTQIHTNVLLSDIIEKWFPNHCKAVKLKREANKAVQECRYEDAILFYSKAIAIVPNDHLLWSNRSRAYLSLDRYAEALEDSKTVIKLRPDWSKGYFHHGCALYELGQVEESVVALLQCLAFDSSIDTAKEYLAKALHGVISPLSPDDPKAAQLQQKLNPSLLHCLIHSNFDSTLMLPTVTVDTVRQLKEIIADTYATPADFLEHRGSNKHAQAIRAEDNGQEIDVLSSSLEVTSKCESVPTLQCKEPWCDDHVDICESTRSAQSKYIEPGKCKSLINQPVVDASLLNSEDFECSLCYRMLYQPVCTPCGHMFCRPCLDKVLDHKTECPLCKTSLAQYLAERRQAVTKVVENLLKAYFPNETEHRKQQHEEELQELASMGSDTQHDIPIFVCTLAYPFVPCPLHIFEPRYRLMIRQCMESGSRQFGMCVCLREEEQAFSNYGCMLEIRDVHFFPDGRSLVDTVGGKRFKVLSRGQREGYNTAKVEFIHDKPSDNLDELKSLSGTLYTACKNWYMGLPQRHKLEIHNHLGEFPAQESDSTYGSSGTAWHWWMIAVLPVDQRIQLAMLAMKSYKERLQGLGKVIEHLNSRRTQ